jgi:glutaredoxin
MTWAVVPATALAIGVTRGWWLALLITGVAVAGEMAYVHAFPYISGLLGYGSVEDEKSLPSAGAVAVPHVVFYTARGCPFCPIVRHRLEQLQHDLHFQFELEEHDITFRPQLLFDKRIRSVPAIEASGRFLVGNATSDQIAAFLKG